MIAHIDGTPVEMGNDVTISIEADEAFPFDIRTVLTSEGIIVDVIQDGEVVATSAEMYLDAAVRLLKDHGVRW